MENNKKTISASEINRFVYCPYQWYYEKLYGRKHIMNLLKERNEKYGYKNSELSNFKSGLKYHKKEYKITAFKSKVFRITMAIIFVDLFFLFLKVIEFVK